MKTKHSRASLPLSAALMLLLFCCAAARAQEQTRAQKDHDASLGTFEKLVASYHYVAERVTTQD
jgi:hypothetical protein